MNEITINNMSLSVKEYQGKRVVTFKDIDTVHGRPEGTARKRFNDNKAHFIEGEDYFVRKTDEARNEFSITAPNGLVLITESGYLMLVKSFTDDLAWDVQRQLVNSYFRTAQMQLSPIEIIAGIANNAVELERRQKQLEAKQQEQEAAIADTNQRLDNMCEVISLDKNSWRKDAQHLVSRIAMTAGCGFDSIRDCYAEIYRLIETRAGVSLSTRLTNMRNRMAGEGVCKSKRDKLNKLDIIAEDKKLIEIYVAIVKEMAVKYGVCA